MNVVPLVLAAALASAPSPSPRAGSTDAAQAWLESLCKTHAADAAVPWGLTHGVGAFGPGFRAKDGRLAIDAAVADNLERRTFGDQVLFRFPATRGSIPVDPHSDHTVMKLLHSGVPQVRVFSTKLGEVSLQRLVDSVRRDFRFEPTDRFWREHAWTLQALADATSEEAASWTNRYGEPVDLGAVMDAAFAHLESLTGFLADAQRDGVAMIPKRKQGIWSHPCGGLHFVQAALSWMNRPGFRKRHLAEARRQADLLFYRLDIETRAYDLAMDQAPEYALQINVQRLKFYGHWLETALRLKELGLWEPTAERRASIDKARKLIARTVAALQAEQVDARMAEFKTMRPQTYFDLLGDSCHAAAGLRETR